MEAVSDPQMTLAALKAGINQERMAIANLSGSESRLFNWDRDYDVLSAQPCHGQVYRRLEQLGITPAGFQALKELADIRNSTFHPAPRMGQSLADWYHGNATLQRALRKAITITL